MHRRTLSEGFFFEKCNLSVHILPISFSRSVFSTQLLTTGCWLKSKTHTPTDALCFLHERFPEHAAELKCVAEYQCRFVRKVSRKYAKVIPNAWYVEFEVRSVLTT
ncbi:hypothetical protein VCRA219O19_70059 [Vibrio crassostreae]|nr:hypothetical protein VCRA219O19_70059 [Vibrio crassostreae]